MLLYSDALGMNAGENASETISEILHESVLVAAEGEMDQACAVFADHGLLRIVIEILANDKNDFAVVKARLGLGKATSAASEISPDIFFQR